MSVVQEAPLDIVRQVFGEHASQACYFAELLAEHAIDKGLIGPRELDRLWDRHLLNSAVLSELLPDRVRIVDIGSGAGFPGIPLAIARPDLQLTLLEPMARRVAWLEEVIDTLRLDVEVVRGRAEEKSVLRRLGGCDVVTARAVAPLQRLAAWSLPLLRSGGQLLAMKGTTAADELKRDEEAVTQLGGVHPRVVLCGAGLLEVPTTVIVVERGQSARRRDAGRRKEKDQ